MMPPAMDVERELAVAADRGDLDRFLRLLAGQEIFVPVHQDDANALLDEKTESFPDVLYDVDGEPSLHLFTRGALPDLGEKIVFTTGSLSWAVAGIAASSPVVVNRGASSELHTAGRELLPWLAANAEYVLDSDDRTDLLVTADYGPLGGPLAHALACGAHLAVANAAPWNLLSKRHYDHIAEVRGLREWWGVVTAADWRETMDGLIGEGYELTPGNLVLLQRLEFAARNHVPDARLSPVTWREAVREWCAANGSSGEQTDYLCRLVGTLTRYEERFRADGLLPPDGFVTTTFSWDLGRAVNMARWGLICGHCDELTAELMVLEASAVARRYHESWPDFSAGYVMGRVLHFDEETFGEWYRSALRVHRILTEDPASPWQYIDFDPTPAS